MAQREKPKVKDLFDDLEKEFDVYCARLIDSPCGVYGHRKPFDGFVIKRGLALEAKWEDGGLTFNLDQWRIDEPNQEIGLWQYWKSGAGHGILIVFWKPKCKGQHRGRIQIRWEYVQNLLKKKNIKFLDMRERQELMDVIKEL